MAHWRLGHEDEARHWRDQAIARLDKGHLQNKELVRFRAEADALIDGKASTTHPATVGAK
jgi:hypothetical protein